MRCAAVAVAAVCGEDAGAEPGGEGGAEEVAEGSGDEGEEAGFGVEEEGDGGAGLAPRERMRPISARRSRMAVAMAAETAKPAARRAAAEMSHMRPEMRVRMVPSDCSTCLTCWACEPGMASRIW